MPTVLLVFEFLGTTELMVIALVALIIFGPRKLPEIGRSLGRSMGEFKRASDDFKRTWEYEVELENRKSATAVADTDTTRGELTVGESTNDVAHAPEASEALAAGEDSAEAVGVVGDDARDDGARDDDEAREREEGRTVARGRVEDGPDAS